MRPISYSKPRQKKRSNVLPRADLDFALPGVRLDSPEPQLPHTVVLRYKYKPSEGGRIVFSNTLCVPQVAGFRRAPVKIKDLKKAIRSRSEG